MRNERVEKMLPDATLIFSKNSEFMARASRVFDYLFVLRPTLFFPVWTVYAAGFFSAKRFLPDAHHVDNSGWGLAIGIALSLLMGSAFILNQLIDVPTDKLNNKLFIIADGHISQTTAILETIILAVIPLGLVAIYSPAMMFMFVAIYLVTGIFYSLPIFKWKDRPVLGIIANAAGAFLIFSAGWWIKNISLLQPFVHAIPYASAVAAVYIFTTIIDMKGDVKFGKVTIAVRFGLLVTVWVGILFEIIALLSAWMLKDPLIFYPALFSFPFFVLAVKRQKIADIIRAIKFPILFLALAICVVLPNYFALLTITYYLSKWYYYYRFGLHYPNLEAK